MGAVKDCWTAFKSQLINDAELSTYVGGRFYPAQDKIINSNSYPFVVYNLSDIPTEEYIGIPKSKYVMMNIEIWGKVKSSTSKITNCLEIDELIKDAIEKDLQLGGAGTITNIDSSDFINLEKDIRETKISCTITSNRFTAGDRS